jgi:hypothetical protein
MEQHDCDESQTLFKIHTERSQNFHHVCNTLSQQKHIVLQSMAPLQPKRFKVGSKMATAASTLVLPNQKKQCCKITRFTDTLCSCIMLAASSVPTECIYVGWNRQYKAGNVNMWTGFNHLRIFSNSGLF